VKPWTIRGVEPEVRNAAIAAADRADMNVGEWLGRAIRAQVQAEAQASRAPVRVGQDSRTDKQRVTPIERVERIAATLRDLAASGVSVSAEHAAEVTGALIAQLPKVRQKRAAGRTDAPASDSPG
jgi:hypothetical protein